MMELNLQYFGGRGSGGGKGSGGGVVDTASIEKKIDRAGFKNQGLGNWEMEIDGVGGAQVLDETGSTRALRAGFMPNDKAYSYNAWKYNENGTVEQLSGLRPTVDIVPTLNEAKSAAKELMKNHITR